LAAFDYALYPPAMRNRSGMFELAPVGCRRFNISPEDLTHRGFIALNRGCAVSVPLPRLSPYRSSDPPFSRRGDFPQLALADLPSATRLLLALTNKRDRDFNLSIEK